MKLKLSLFITLLLSLLITTSCTTNVDLDKDEVDAIKNGLEINVNEESSAKTKPTEPEGKNENSKIEEKTPSNISDAISFTLNVEDNELLSKVSKILNSGNHKLEITKKPSYELPAGIHDAQIDKYYVIDDVLFALVRKPSMNVPINLPEGFKADFAGLIVANTTNKEWKKIFTVEDKESTNKNNPYAIWIDQKALYISIVDQNGAGSGEGIAKIIKSNDLINWQTDYCYYFGGEYRGPNEDGDYFRFSSFLVGEEQSGNECNNFSLE